MREEHYFYCPDVASGELPAGEVVHALRVLRMKEGDEMHLIDGVGGLYRARIDRTTKNSCYYSIVESEQQPRLWRGRLEIAVAPTKQVERMEWLVEKATEIGVDRITFLDCCFSERKRLNREHLERIAISAAKQSHKAFVPTVEDVVEYEEFIGRTPQSGRRFIAHCYDDATLCPNGKPFLLDLLGDADDGAIVMVGPEGDFSFKEIELAIKAGFEPTNLGKSRLRTETAALVAVHLMNLKNRC